MSSTIVHLECLLSGPWISKFALFFHIPAFNFLSRVPLTQQRALSVCTLYWRADPHCSFVCTAEGTLQVCLWILQLIILPQTIETDLDDSSINSTEGVIRENSYLHSPPQCWHITVDIFFWMWLITQIILRNEIKDHPRITPVMF